ncbi:MAG: hypothetical protein QW303_00015 [Nitrososphaerota archaeon]
MYCWIICFIIILLVILLLYQDYYTCEYYGTIQRKFSIPDIAQEKETSSLLKSELQYGMGHIW